MSSENESHGRGEPRGEAFLTEPDRWDAVAELGVDVVFRIGVDGTVLDVSEGTEPILGEPPSAVVGDRFLPYVAPEDREKALRTFQRVLDGEPAREVSFRLQGREERSWVELSADPVEEGGEVVGVRGAGREVTDRRQRRRSLERRSTAMESAIDGMAILDADGEYVYLNEAHAALYGYEREELLGRSWRCLYGPEERDRLANEVLPRMEAEGSWRGAAVGRRKDGSTFRQELSLAPLDDGGLVCVVRDVSERHQREAMARVLDRVLRHNLRNDMNVILGEAQAIERRGDGRVADAARRIRRTASDLLGTSESAREVRRTVVEGRSGGATDLTAVVERCSGRLAEVVGCDLTVESPDEPLRVPDYGVDSMVRELLENPAEHAGPDPEVRVELSRTDVESAEAEPMALLRVIDDGPGLPEMERQVLTANRETPLQHSQGLGLWLANWVVTEAGGDLSVRDREPQGTVIEARLPLVEE